MAIPVIYGIPNCDTVKKARRWLEQHGIEYRFHDFRRDGLNKSQLQNWLKAVDVDTLLNRRSRTWRELDDNAKNNITKSKAIDLMLEQPSLIKRPVLAVSDQVIVGFDNKQYTSLLAA